MDVKECLSCKIQKPVSEFYFADRKRGYLSSQCKICVCSRKKAYYYRKAKHKTLAQEMQRRRLKRQPLRVKAIELYSSGLSTRQVSKAIGVPYGTVGAWTREANVSRNHKECCPLGEKHWGWKGGRKRNSHHLDSADYRAWRSAVFERDKFTCVCCQNVGGELRAHHILAWAKYPTERFNVKNGVTLCEDCHKWLHHRKVKVA